MKIITAYIFLIIASCLLSGCCSDDDTRGVYTKNSLSELTVHTLVASENSGELPPPKICDYVTWLQENDADHIEEFNGFNSSSVYIDFANDTVVDVWGNEVKIVYENDVYTGLGSCGPDGKWSNGEGDDIFVPATKVEHK